jgi:hypothetical protein
MSACAGPFVPGPFPDDGEELYEDGVVRALPMTRGTPLGVRAHQLTVLQRQLGRSRPAFTGADRASLAALLAPLPPADCIGCSFWSARTPCCAATVT